MLLIFLELIIHVKHIIKINLYVINTQINTTIFNQIDIS